MNQEPTTRHPPRIIYVPPPVGLGMPSRHIGKIIATGAIAAAICLIPMIVLGADSHLFLAIMIPCLVIVVIIFLFACWLQNNVNRARRRSFFASQPVDESDPLIAALQGRWKESDRVPEPNGVRTLLESHGAPEPADRAVVVCFGEADVPEIGELCFEPEIIAPSEAMWRRFIWPTIAVALVLLFLLDYTGFLPPWFPPGRSLLRTFAPILAVGVVTFALWMWRGVIRPTYVRMAPGVIQMLQYRSFKSKPNIRSYPMVGGTLACVTRIGKRVFLTLSRGPHKDTLFFSHMRQPQQWIERTWRALLSTAATPPLSEDELVG